MAEATENHDRRWSLDLPMAPCQPELHETAVPRQESFLVAPLQGSSGGAGARDQVQVVGGHSSICEIEMGLWWIATGLLPRV
uniref:Uncharacterized protein n=1 Tax=Arundo donax TaxID=35708 RepID=A0A0A9FI40_ARUDO